MIIEHIGLEEARPQVVTLTVMGSTENSVNFTTPTLTSETVSIDLH